MPGVDFNLLRQEITMQQVLELLSFQPVSRKGDQLRGPCPLHGSTNQRSRSLAINLQTQRYYCHKCHVGGNQLELWAAVHKQNLYQAAIHLCRSLGKEPPWIKRW